MTAAEIKAECERIWREQACRQPWYVTRWEIHGAKLIALRGHRYNPNRKSKYLGHGPKYLTTEGRENMYAHRQRIEECLMKSQSRLPASKGARANKRKGALSSGVKK